MRVVHNGQVCDYNVRTGEYTPIGQGVKTPAPQSVAPSCNSKDYTEIRNKIQRELAGKVEK